MTSICIVHCPLSHLRDLCTVLADVIHDVTACWQTSKMPWKENQIITEILTVEKGYDAKRTDGRIYKETYHLRRWIVDLYAIAINVHIGTSNFYHIWPFSF